MSKERVCLERAIPFMRNSFKPFFTGRFETSARGTVLLGRFSVHRGVQVFITLWLCLALLWTLAAVVFSIQQHKWSWLIPVFGLGMMLAGVGIVRFGSWFASSDVAWLSKFITRALSEPD